MTVDTLERIRLSRSVFMSDLSCEPLSSKEGLVSSDTAGMSAVPVMSSFFTFSLVITWSSWFCYQCVCDVAHEQ